jgi:TRAP-type transport system periplasmic protein
MTRASFILLLSLATLSGCHKTPGKPEIILRLGHQANEQDVWHLSSLYFAKVVDSLSHGRIRVDVFATEQLGRELDMIRSIQAGIADMTITGESMQVWADITSFCGMPYLIRDFDHLKQVVEGPAGKRIADEMINKIHLRPLAYFPRGARHLTSNRPIRTPDDLKGMILRVPTVPISVKTWEALGAKPTPMTFSEVFTALQQGTVEGQENPFALIYSAGFSEVQKYVNLTGHVIGWVYVVIGEKKFQSLKPEDQELILNAGKAMQDYHEKIFFQQEKLLRQKLADQGMQFVETDVNAFRLKAREAVMNNLSPSLKAFYSEIQNMPETHHEKDSSRIQ